MACQPLLSVIQSQRIDCDIVPLCEPNSDSLHLHVLLYDYPRPQLLAAKMKKYSPQQKPISRRAQWVEG